jgi:hypothetical protein
VGECCDKTTASQYKCHQVIRKTKAQKIWVSLLAGGASRLCDGIRGECWGYVPVPGGTYFYLSVTRSYFVMLVSRSESVPIGTIGAATELCAWKCVLTCTWPAASSQQPAASSQQPTANSQQPTMMLLMMMVVKQLEQQMKKYSSDDVSNGNRNKNNDDGNNCSYCNA